ncbi:MAG: ATP-grasp domain-containing protein, partial [Patescibacteria group bacterium]
MSKKIVVVYKGDDWKKKIPFTSIPTRESFQDWHERGLKNGIEMFRASIDWFDSKKNVFLKSWAYRNGQWEKINQPIKADLIFDKIAGKFDYSLFGLKMDIFAKTKIFNHPLFRTMFDNKMSQYVFLKEFMAESFLVNSEKELAACLKRVKSKKVVIKPLYGSGGFNIIIDEKNNIKTSRINFPVLVQNFIISTKGIPGFSKGRQVADLRMIFMNHKFIYALSRIAKGASLFTNFHQGARAMLVPQKAIPEKVWKMARQIVGKLSVFSEANYSLDFIFDDKGEPFLV